jgi:hypothetical protein
LFDPGAAEQRATLQENAEHLGGFEIDYHLSVGCCCLVMGPQQMASSFDHLVGANEAA